MVTLTVSQEDARRILSALDTAAEDAADKGQQDRKWGDPETADEMQAAADQYSDLAVRLANVIHDDMHGPATNGICATCAEQRARPVTA